MSCQVKVILDKSSSYTYTNLDTIQGRVVVKVNKEISVENIQIKLEGISTAKVTKKVRKQNGDYKMESKSEVHYLIYDCDTLFPPDNIKKVTKNQDGFTLIPGTYDYRFEFKIPMTCYCGDPDSVKYFSNIYNSPEEKYAVTSVQAQRIQQQKINANANINDPSRASSYHIKCPLPPTSSGQTGYNNGFDIKYFLKVTVRRTSMFKSNIREVIPIPLSNFDPDDNTIARYLQNVTEINNRSKEYIFKKQYRIEGQSSKQEKQGFFRRAIADPNLVKKTIPFNVDIRFTDKIIRLNQSPSLDIFIVTRLPPSEFRLPNGQSNSLGKIYVSRLVLTLVRKITFRAQNFVEELTRTIELRNLQRVCQLDLVNASRNAEGLYQVQFPSEIFEKMNLPSSELPPSFRTCNMTNVYSLRVLIGLKQSSDSHSEQTVDFSTDVWVLSGLPPPFPVGNVTSGEFEAPSEAPPSTIYSAPPSAPPPATRPSQVIDSNTPVEQIPIAQENDNANVTEQLPSYNEALSASTYSPR